LEAGLVLPGQDLDRIPARPLVGHRRVVLERHLAPAGEPRVTSPPARCGVRLDYLPGCLLHQPIFSPELPVNHVNTAITRVKLRETVDQPRW
jgi:hypothetical protein